MNQFREVNSIAENSFSTKFIELTSSVTDGPCILFLMREFCLIWMQLLYAGVKLKVLVRCSRLHTWGLEISVCLIEVEDLGSLSSLTYRKEPSSSPQKPKLGTADSWQLFFQTSSIVTCITEEQLRFNLSISGETSARVQCFNHVQMQLKLWQQRSPSHVKKEVVWPLLLISSLIRSVIMNKFCEHNFWITRKANRELLALFVTQWTLKIERQFQKNFPWLTFSRSSHFHKVSKLGPWHSKFFKIYIIVVHQWPFKHTLMGHFICFCLCLVWCKAWL